MSPVNVSHTSSEKDASFHTIFLHPALNPSVKIFRLTCLSLFYASLLATFLSTLCRSTANEHFVQYFHNNAEHHLKFICNDTQASGHAGNTVNRTVSTTQCQQAHAHSVGTFLCLGPRYIYLSMV